MESRLSKITPKNSATPFAIIATPIELEIEQLCAQARELVALAMELNELHRQVAKMIAAALQLSRRAAEMQRKRRKARGRSSRLPN